MGLEGIVAKRHDGPYRDERWNESGRLHLTKRKGK
jgi:hypothetical protein